jgi:hypothetical protein
VVRLGSNTSTSTYRGPSHCGLARDYRSTSKRRPNQRDETTERSTSRALLPSTMSQNRRNKTTAPVQSNAGAVPPWITPSLEAPQNRRKKATPPVRSNAGAVSKWIPPSLEVPQKANLNSVGGTSTSAEYVTFELFQGDARYRPDPSRPTHSGFSEPAGNNSTPAASAKVILATSLDTHVSLKLLLQKLTLS